MSTPPDDRFGPELARRVVVGYAAAHPGRRISDLGPVDAVASRVLSALEASERSPWAGAVGPVYPTSTVRALLGGVTRQALLDRVRRNKLISMRTADGHLVWPAWQFRDRAALPGLDRVLGAVDHGVVDSWTLASWLRAPQPAAGGRSVADLLSGGEPSDIECAVGIARAASSRWAA